MSIARIYILQSAPGQTDKLAAALHSLADIVRTMEGSEEVEVLRDQGATGRFIFIERWADAAAQRSSGSNIPKEALQSVMETLAESPDASFFMPDETRKNENKNVVMSFLGSGNGLKGLRDFATDGARWWVAGGGFLTLDQLEELSDNIADKFSGPIDMQIHDVIADDFSVAVEMESNAPLKNAGAYNNRYHIKFLIRDGKINEVREYHDTNHAFGVLGNDFIPQGVSPY